MALAIFDLDETLIGSDSDHEWGQFVSDKGLVDAAEHRKKNDYFYGQYKLGRLNIDEYLQFSCSVLTKYTMADLHKYRADYLAERVMPLILPKARSLIASHRKAGDELLVITSTIEFVVAPIVAELGIDTVIAPMPEIKNNRYTGRIVGVPSFAAGKVTRLKSWLEQTGHSIEGAYFYSDSHNDLPLLRIVDHPIAVDPDDILRAEATEKKWKIISLRD